MSKCFQETTEQPFKIDLVAADVDTVEELISKVDDCIVCDACIFNKVSEKVATVMAMVAIQKIGKAFQFDSF